MHVVGMDLSTRSIAMVSLVDETVAQALELKVPGATAEDRFDELLTKAHDYIVAAAPERVMIEGIPFVRNPRSELALAQVQGAVMAGCLVAGAEYRVVNNTVWKKQVGTGRTKEQIAAFVAATGVEFKSQNLRDAYAIALYGTRFWYRHQKRPCRPGCQCLRHRPKIDPVARLHRSEAAKRRGRTSYPHPDGCACLVHRLRSTDQAFIAARHSRMSRPQLDLANYLLAVGYDDLALEVPFGRAFIDIYAPNEHLAFEADGSYWHSLPGRSESDKARDATLMKEFELPVIRFSELECHELFKEAQRWAEASHVNNVAP